MEKTLHPHNKKLCHVCMKSKEEDIRVWEEMAEYLHQEGPVMDSPFEDADWLDIKRIHKVRRQVAQLQELQAPEEAWQRQLHRMGGKQVFTAWMKYAAVAAIAILVTSASFFAYNTVIKQESFAVISSPNGQITNVTLFDGTNVWLNSGSSLKYSQSFNQRSRDIYLTGEALFQVTKNPRKTFTVHARGAEVKVHGTVFDVKAYSDIPTMETVLLEGKVEFVGSDKSVFLAPGEKLVYTPETGQLSKTLVNTNEYTAWKGGKIYFNDESLEQLAIQMERWYEIKFRFETEEVKKYRFTGVLNKDKSLDYTLNIIQSINKIKFKKEKEEVLILEAK